jgi:hypothetical protein
LTRLSAVDRVATVSTEKSSQETTASPEREQLLGRVVIAVAKANFDSGDPTSEMIDLTVNICGASLNRFSNYTLSLVCDPALNANWRTTAARGIFMLWDEQKISDYLSNAYDLQGDSNMTNSNSLNVIDGYLMMLSHYKELAPLGAEHAVERARQTAAILKVTFHIKATATPEIRQNMILDIKGDIRDYHLPYINDDKLRALLLTSTYDREAVLAIVTQRNIYDADHIVSLLDGISAPLVAGAL